MKSASILAAFVVLLGFAREAKSIGVIHIDRDYTIEIGENEFGFRDLRTTGGNFPSRRRSEILLGAFGEHDIPITAIQGLIGFCCSLAILFSLAVALAIRWKMKRVVL